VGTDHIAAVIAHSTSRGSHLLVLTVIANYCGPQGEWVTKQAILQKQTRLGRRHVQKILGDLAAAGELAVTPGNGRGNPSTYRLLLSPKSAAHTAHPHPSRASQTTLSAPPCPPFPPNPQSPLNPPKNLETYGLHASPPELFPVSPLPAGREGDGRGAGGEEPFAPQSTNPSQQVPPLPFGEGGGGTHGRGAGGEGPIRPLTPAQSATFRVHLLLEEAAVPLPTPSQIGLWAKTLGGIDPLLDLLRQLIEAGLATKREPIVYTHRVVMERAARPQPAPRANRSANRSANKELLRTAGVDDVRRAQAARIAAQGGDE
jgi:hypothetical protein